MSETKDLSEARQRLALFIQQQRTARDVDMIRHEDVLPGVDKSLTFVQVASPVISIFVSREVEDGN